jgi:hypothetical protein
MNQDKRSIVKARSPTQLTILMHDDIIYFISCSLPALIIGLKIKSTYLLNLDPPELPDDLNFWVGGFGGLDGGFELLCSLVVTCLGGL